jgi:hypothetical protein
MQYASSPPRRLIVGEDAYCILLVRGKDEEKTACSSGLPGFAIKTEIEYYLSHGQAKTCR